MPEPRRDSSDRRRDAQENRARIIAAARELFAREGFEVPLDAIAQKAGVGRGTLYRNFADRFALGSAIFERNLTELEALARELGPRPDAFLVLLQAIIKQQGEAHALVPALLSGPRAPDLQALSRRVTRLLAAPLKRAQATGSVRPDLRTADVLSLIAMISAGIAGPASRRRVRAARVLDLVLTGILHRKEA